MAEAEALISSMIQRLNSRRAVGLGQSTPELVKKGVERVIDELRMILDFLKDKKLGEGSRLDYLLDDVVEMTQDVLNLDEINYCSTFKERFDSIRTCFREARLRMLKFGVDGAETERAEKDVDGDGDGNGNEGVVGLEEEVELLLNRAIFYKKQSLSISFVIGMVGIGKTTLVRQLYNHAVVIDRFERRAWVRVSSHLSNREVLIKLIQQVVVEVDSEGDSLLMEKLQRANKRSLQLMLRQHLQGMRYFIVLDHMPQGMHLKSILKALPPREEKGSRLLITSRTKYTLDVFEGYTHEMTSLDSDKSWQLFMKTINMLTNEHRFPRQLSVKGREMLTKCGGLPLAIKEAARQLVEKRCAGVEWERLIDEPIDMCATMELLELCYQRLDPEVKSCFLHLCFFKENTTMRVEKLTRIWGVGEMVPRSETLLNLFKLMNHCIVEVTERSIDWGLKTCRINPMLHRLSIEKAEEEIGFAILRNDGNNPPPESRHRTIICNREKFDYSTNQDKHVVSLFFHGGGYFNASPSYWEHFELLKILDLDDFGLKILPKTFGMLMELRYLGLRNNYVQELPRSLGYLKKLEILDISQNFMVEVPDIIWEMRSLRRLYMSDVIFRKPLKIDWLWNLETLAYISVDDWAYEFLDMPLMTELWKVGIQQVDGNPNVSKLFASLAKLKNLKSLILRGYRFRSMSCLDELRNLHSLNKLKLDGLIRRLPSADNFPPYIYYLNLVDTCLDEDPMPVLEKLPNLLDLKLRNAYTGVRMVIPQYSFPHLLVLCIEELWNLRDLHVGEGAMPALHRLEIQNCPRLETLPEEIGFMTELNKLKIVTTKKIAMTMRKSTLISHIRDVDIDP